MISSAAIGIGVALTEDREPNGGEESKDWIESCAFATWLAFIVELLLSPLLEEVSENFGKDDCFGGFERAVEDDGPNRDAGSMRCGGAVVLASVDVEVGLLGVWVLVGAGRMVGGCKDTTHKQQRSVY